MLLSWVLTLIFFLGTHGHTNGVHTETGKCPNIKNSLASVRKRRNLTFPEDSTVVLTISLAKTFHTHMPSGWNVVMELDVIFPLPDANFTLAHARRKLHYRQKKDLWHRIGEAVDMHNMNGHECILKSICEAETHLAPKGKSLVHDILRSIFTAPRFEMEFRKEMRDSFEDALDPHLCERIHECPMSILDFILDLNKPK